MSTFVLVIAVIIAVISAAGLYRVIAGKTVFDRVIAAGMIGNNGILLLVLIGFIYDRIDMFVDIAIAYALLNFVAVIVIGKYFDARKRRN